MAADKISDVLDSATKLVDALNKAEPIVDAILFVTAFLFAYFFINMILVFIKESKEAVLIKSCNAVLMEVKGLLGEVKEQLR